MLLSSLTPVIILPNENVGRGELESGGNGIGGVTGTTAQAVAKQRNNQANVSEGIMTLSTPLVFHCKIHYLL